LLPGDVGTVGGVFFGFAFGMGGIGAALLGELADVTSIAFVYHVCAYLPVISLLTAFLPDLERRKPLAVSRDRKSTRLNSSHLGSSYAVFCLKKKIHFIQMYISYTDA